MAFSELFAPCDENLLTCISLMSTVKLAEDLDCVKMKYLIDWMDLVFSFYMNNPGIFEGTTRAEDAEGHMQQMVDGLVDCVRSGFALEFSRLHALVSVNRAEFNEQIKQLQAITKSNVTMQTMSFMSALGSAGAAWAANLAFEVKDGILLAEAQANGLLQLSRPWYVAHVTKFANVAAGAAIFAGAIAIAGAIVSIVHACHEEAELQSRLQEVERVVMRAIRELHQLEKAEDI